MPSDNKNKLHPEKIPLAELWPENKWGRPAHLPPKPLRPIEPNPDYSRDAPSAHD